MHQWFQLIHHGCYLQLINLTTEIRFNKLNDLELNASLDNEVTVGKLDNVKGQA